MNPQAKKHFLEAIRQVLIEKGHCSLEHFGTFYLLKTSARINNQTQTLIPPKTEARFNSAVHHPDPFLISVFIKLTNLNEKDAKAHIQEFTAHFRRWLDWKKEVRIPGIGTIVSDEVNNFYLLSEFVHPEDIGKKNIFLSELKTQLNLNSLNNSINDNDSLNKPENIIKEKINTYSIHITDKEPQKSNRFLFLRAAAIFFILIFLMALLLWFFNKQEWNRQQIYLASILTSENRNASYIPSDNFLSHSKIIKFIYPKPSYLFDEKGFASVNIQGMDFKVALSSSGNLKSNWFNGNVPSAPLTPSFSLNSTKHTGYYFIIVGSFSRPENAKRFFEKLKNKGYNPSFAGISQKGLQMVAATNATTAEMAESELQRIRKEFPTAWIFKP